MSNVVYQPFHEMWPIGHFTQKRGEQIPDILIYREQTFPESCPHQTSPTTRFTFTVPSLLFAFGIGDAANPLVPQAARSALQFVSRPIRPITAQAHLGLACPSTVRVFPCRRSCTTTGTSHRLTPHRIPDSAQPSETATPSSRFLFVQRGSAYRWQPTQNTQTALVSLPAKATFGN